MNAHNFMMNETIHKQTRSVRDVVYETLKNGILSEQLSPEMHLKERALSEQLGVSTTPIKEALRRLELEGLVYTRPRRGTFVSTQIMKSVEEITLARSSLEGVAARLAASKITEEQKKQLGTIIEQMEVYTMDKNSDGLRKSNEAFHHFIIKAAKNDYIEKQITSLKAFANVVRKHALANVNELDRAYEEHHLIFTKVGSNDPDGAEEAMRNHIRRTLSFCKENKQGVNEK
ncbi:GntR family transcriptional regulator [Fictibacillus sp. S7]|uniref:GntR family transcriptional regulator n=1 Tax=Fictibacillus sp. S7 TaxID=2212476 RepID=UPI001F524C1E|nr:GntR family transcriptional regulator [Fictibacillus sp. S7]